MFDTRKVGTKIAALRKAKDMTQMELADHMGVSYQAVSNWERGNTMPDISKLVELSQILGTTIEEMLGSEQETRVIEKIINEEPDVSLDEAVEVLPLLKPSQVEDFVDEVEDETLKIETLVDIAPYVSAEKLAGLVDNAKFEDLKAVVPLAPYLESGQLAGMVERQISLEGSLADLVVLAPFLESSDLTHLINRQQELTGSIEDIVPLAPFMESKALDTLARKLFNAQEDSHQLVALAPFMEQETLAWLAGEMTSEQRTHDLPALAPFIDSHKLTAFARKMLDAGDRRGFKQLLPFIDADEL